MTIEKLNSRALSQLQATVLLVILLASTVLLTYWIGNGYIVTLVTLLFVYIMLGVSLTGTNGYTGIFSLAYPAFMMVGAYVSIIFTYPVGRRGFAMPSLPDILVSIQLPLWLAACIGAFVAVVVAWFVGKVVLRLKTHYLAVASLGLIIVAKNIALNLDGITRGGRGLTGVPRDASLWFVALCTLLVIVFFWRLKQSSIGRAMLAVREDELAARAYGIEPEKLKLYAFMLGAFVAGYCGALIPHVIGIMTPNSFGLLLAFNLIAVIVVGGQGSVIGAIIGTVIFRVGAELVRPIEEATGYFGLVQILIALVVVLVLFYRPNGLFGLREPWVKL